MSSCSNPSQLIPCATFGPKRPPDCLMLSKGGKILPFSDRFSCLASSQPALMTLLTHQNAQLKSVLTKKWNTARHASPVVHIALTCSSRPKIARNEIESTFGHLDFVKFIFVIWIFWLLGFEKMLWQRNDLLTPTIDLLTPTKSCTGWAPWGRAPPVKWQEIRDPAPDWPHEHRRDYFMYVHVID